MKYVIRSMACCVMVLTLLSFTGCKPKEGADSDNSTTTTTDSTDPKIEASLAKLDPADRAAAEKQKTCPVSGAKLGSMDKPYKVTVEGRDVFLCCDGCEGKLKEDPAKYLAKLPQ